MLKTKDGFLLRRLGAENVLIGIGEESKRISGMIRLNGTGVFYWEELKKGTTKEALIEKTLERFDDAVRETVEKDVQEFLEEIAITLENDEMEN